MMSDSVTQDLDRHMDEQEQQELEHNKELERAEDIVEDLHSTIMSLQKYEYENNTEVIYCDRYNEVTITINMSEVEGEAFVESLDRRSTPKYIAEKTWVDVGNKYPKEG